MIKDELMEFLGEDADTVSYNISSAGVEVEHFPERKATVHARCINITSQVNSKRSDSERHLVLCVFIREPEEGRFTVGVLKYYHTHPT